MENKKGFWRSFNPTLKDMMERYPEYSVLGMWWSFTWRIWLVSMTVMIAFWIVVAIFAIALHH